MSVSGQRRRYEQGAARYPVTARGSELRTALFGRGPARTLNGKIPPTILARSSRTYGLTRKASRVYAGLGLLCVWGAVTLAAFEPNLPGLAAAGALGATALVLLWVKESWKDLGRTYTAAPFPVHVMSARLTLDEAKWREMPASWLMDTLFEAAGLIERVADELPPGPESVPVCAALVRDGFTGTVAELLALVCSIVSSTEPAELTSLGTEGRPGD